MALENGTMIDVKIRGSSTKWSKRDKYAYFLHKITHSLNYISNDQSQPNANGILRTSLQGKKTLTLRWKTSLDCLLFRSF